MSGGSPGIPGRCCMYDYMHRDTASKLHTATACNEDLFKHPQWPVYRTYVNISELSACNAYLDLKHCPVKVIRSTLTFAGYQSQPQGGACKGPRLMLLRSTGGWIPEFAWRGSRPKNKRAQRSDEQGQLRKMRRRGRDRGSLWMSNRCSIRTTRRFERDAKRYLAFSDVQPHAEDTMGLVQRRRLQGASSQRAIGAAVCLRGRRKERCATSILRYASHASSAHAEPARPRRLPASDDYRINATFLAISGRMPVSAALFSLPGTSPDCEPRLLPGRQHGSGRGMTFAFASH
ncbi:hypothetical protein L227DRAFT_249910 [Lentinus tigrinus ALCF2SS1-6]|uniref:Uncharacterized protein n=1 Tax=Lentinus tigrinus ALCF2SS1-6 TaxID=1328759 RepID=A0A5C2S0A5_9APHY|nr:hypothetical protein L227DRAFT_249910 [Lentinus tigrinus ALCF2SS1-6]